MQIDFVSDVSCPWCAIGLSSLSRAIERLGPALQPHIHFQPFELNPGMAPEGEDVAEHLAAKYGGSPEQLAQNHAAIRDRGAAVGVTFNFRDGRRIYNTFNAHRLLHWAGLEGPAGAQQALKRKLFEAYFTHGESPADPAVLLRLVGEVGLDASRAAQILQGDEFAAEVRERERHYQQLGIHSVPAVIVDGKYLIQGGQPVEVFEQALRKIAEGTAG